VEPAVSSVATRRAGRAGQARAADERSLVAARGYVKVGDETWIAGTADGHWGIEPYMGDGEGAVDTTVPSTSTNVITIADALAAVIKKEAR
jgi:hypothetical protein